MKETMRSCAIQNLCQGVDGKHKEQRRKRVALPETASMGNWGTGNTIENNAGGRGGQQGGDPIAEATWKSPTLEEIKNEFPTDRVKSFSNVKLEQKCRSFPLVEFPGEVSNVEEIIMDTSLFYKGALSIGDEFVHKRAKPSCEHFGDDFGYGVDQTDGPIIRDVLCPFFLW
jgi:hypothetical protein